MKTSNRGIQFGKIAVALKRHRWKNKLTLPLTQTPQVRLRMHSNTVNSFATGISLTCKMYPVNRALMPHNYFWPFPVLQSMTTSVIISILPRYVIMQSADDAEKSVSSCGVDALWTRSYFFPPKTVQMYTLACLYVRECCCFKVLQQTANDHQRQDAVETHSAQRHSGLKRTSEQKYQVASLRRRSSALPVKFKVELVANRLQIFDSRQQLLLEEKRPNSQCTSLRNSETGRCGVLENDALKYRKFDCE